MKFLRILFILWMLHILTGCMKEDDSMCPKHNVTLYFSLLNVDGHDIFNNHISAVDILIYSVSGTFIQREHVGQNELDRFQGARLLLPAGVYYLICWGNVHNNTQYNGIETQNIPTITYAVIDGNNSAGPCDPLYYSSAITTRATELPEASLLTVPEQGEWQGTAFFRAAHHQIEVYIKGYDQKENRLPQVEFTALPAGVCLSNMAPLPDRSVVKSNNATQIVTMQGEPYAATRFFTFRFEPNNLITINIINPSTGEIVYSLPLSEVMEMHPSPHTIIIRMVIEFKNTCVVVTFPDWSLDDIGFGFGWDY